MKVASPRRKPSKRWWTAPTATRTSGNCRCSFARSRAAELLGPGDRHSAPGHPRCGAGREGQHASGQAAKGRPPPLCAPPCAPPPPCLASHGKADLASNAINAARHNKRALLFSSLLFSAFCNFLLLHLGSAFVPVRSCPSSSVCQILPGAWATCSDSASESRLRTL